MKFVYIGIVAVIFVLAVLRGISGEDDWMCKDGQWVQHGHPSAPMPTRECK